MAPNPHIKKAFAAMNVLGIDNAQVKPVLKNLLTLYDKNWELIAEDNYRALADAIFDGQETQFAEEDEDDMAESVPPLKRLRRGGEGGSSLTCSKSTSPSLGSPTLKELVTYEEQTAPILLPIHPLPIENNLDAGAFTIPKEVPLIDMPSSSIHPGSLDRRNSSVTMAGVEKTNGHVEDGGGKTVSTDFGTTVVERICEDNLAETQEKSSVLELASSASGEVKINLSFAPGTGGSNLHLPSAEELRRAVEDKCLRSYKILDPKFSVVSLFNDLCSCFLELATKAVKSDSQTPESLPFFTPNVDIWKKSAEKMALTTNGGNDLGKKAINSENLSSVTAKVDGFKKSATEMASTSKGSSDNMCDDEHSGGGDSMGLVVVPDLGTKAINSENLSFVMTKVDGFKKSATKMASTSKGSGDNMCDDEHGGGGDSMRLVVVPECQISADEWRLISSVSDITLGKETVEIPWVNEVNSKVPPRFCYIPQSLVYLDAAVKFSLGNIRDDQCCSSCCGDCLAPSMACNCATALNGYTYAEDGLLQEDFLEEYISEARDPRKQVVQYCKECPFENATKNETLEPCKGHLKRKFIKECWSKCGCVKKCGNRVIQHGIHNKLQVFFTPDGRGWGLRTLEKLPKGAFVCEFAGEILTISELFQRGSEKLASPVKLDAHWGPEGVSGVNKALCLDGTHFGNISRFINHRCLDANLIEIPVHVENTDFHYYHPAFFTTREIDAMEELTRDYGVEFNDHVFPTTPFHCRCGSKLCQNTKQISKSKKAKKRA
ncbi:unnamed protein product [Cochlearia groenlandica]